MRLQPAGRGLHNYRTLGVSNDEWVSLVAHFRSQKTEALPISIDSSYDLDGVESIDVEDAWYFHRDLAVDLCVWPDGEMTPTDLLWPDHWSLGNLGSIQDVRDLKSLLMHSTRLGQLEEAHSRVGGKCIQCRVIQKCRGGSRVVAMALADDLFAPDPFCPHEPPKYAY
jgi:radical SAM protein with 4Fe4S-binding SPASM domain